jgi:RNA polymerase sigma factor (sigma-70 family)
MPLEALIINHETPIEGIAMEAVSPITHLEPHVRAAAQGDPEAFARLVDATRTVVCSIALAILRDVEASQDVAQDVFLAAWRDLGKLRNPASFLPWLRQMTRNRAHHMLRGRVRLRRVISDAEADDLLAAASDPRPGSSDRLLAAEEERLLAEALGELSDEAREVVSLYYREGRSVRQVADLLGLREEAVKQRLSRARSRLRETMLDRLGTTLQRTAPGAAFTAAVMTALSLSAPATATAAGIAASAKLSSIGPWAKLGALLGGAGLGIAGGIAGILLGTRRYFALARDDQERRGLRLYAVAAIALVLAATWGMVASHDNLWGEVLSVVLFDAGLLGLIFGWLPRVTARRRAAEIAEDPAALRRYQRERRRQILMAILATLVTSGLVIWTILQRGS